jgi:hypothetical protein
MRGHSSPQFPLVERIRRFAAALTEIISILERTLLKIFRSAERILFHIVIFAGALYAVYQILKHH